MKIAFDSKRAFLNNSGLGNYSRTLIKSLNNCFPKNNFILYTTRQGHNEFQQYILSHSNVSIEEPKSFMDKKLRSRWRSYSITDSLEELGIDIFHGLSNELPFNIHKFKGKKIVTIHDLLFLRYPKLYPFLDRKIYNKKFRHACDQADIIIAISEETKRDIENFYFIPESKIKVVYQSCDELYNNDFSDLELNNIKVKYNLPPNFLLYVGTIEERKNLLTIVKALKQVNEMLVVVGKKKNYFNLVKNYLKDNNLEPRVLFLENVENADLPGIYRMAKLFLFPSLYEGFGIPIIEALTSKIPVITSKGGCFPEAGGPNSIYINPTDENELAEKINLIFSSKEIRNEMVEKGFEYVQKFHPKIITKELMSVYSGSRLPLPLEEGNKN